MKFIHFLFPAILTQFFLLLNSVAVTTTPNPTSQPTMQPSSQPSSQPSRQPSSQPTLQPSNRPTTQPTNQPTLQPTNQPTCRPSIQPTNQPSTQPTMQPTTQPTVQPSSQPSRQPSVQPSVQPTTQPSSAPSVSDPDATGYCYLQYYSDYGCNGTRTYAEGSSAGVCVPTKAGGGYKQAPWSKFSSSSYSPAWYFFDFVQELVLLRVVLEWCEKMRETFKFLHGLLPSYDLLSRITSLQMQRTNDHVLLLFMLTFCLT
jgi:hypothetical protein